ncbi:hypothetical protein KFL_012150020 [Klebsormidium nitens]|uniref:Uncharacterized protein n=1 Tax=Klebsormidium nitens TaxID=105231 RepID=A0A1Y1IQI6_KLENI|nr:hypothetical protein KFL_012150020 [Klebsormidium nitens]|eukprot:GAQ92943.1 hypothetical protein KFL_012150020 [Klebsormidium nitens]
MEGTPRGRGVEASSQIQTDLFARGWKDLFGDFGAIVKGTPQQTIDWLLMIQDGEKRIPYQRQVFVLECKLERLLAPGMVCDRIVENRDARDEEPDDSWANLRPRKRTSQDSGLQAEQAAVAGKHLVAVGDLYDFFEKGERPSVEDHRSVFEKLLLGFPDHPEAGGEYAEALRRVAQQALAIEPDRVLFKAYPRNIGSGVERIEKGEGDPLYVVDMGVFLWTSQHAAGVHRDGSPVDADGTCEKGCGPAAFIKEVMKKMNANVDNLIMSLTRNIETPVGKASEELEPDAETEKEGEKLPEPDTEKEPDWLQDEAEWKLGEVDSESAGAPQEEGDPHEVVGQKRKSRGGEQLGAAEKRARLSAEEARAQQRIVSQCLDPSKWLQREPCTGGIHTEPNFDGTFCCEIPALTRIGELHGGVGVYSDTQAHESLADLRSLGLEEFADVIIQLTGLFGVPTAKVNIFWSVAGEVTAFNQAGNLYFNMAYSFSSWKWFVIVAHELAHNVEKEHGIRFVKALEHLITDSGCKFEG